jgi:hypothetical protein
MQQRARYGVCCTEKTCACRALMERQHVPPIWLLGTLSKMQKAGRAGLQELAACKTLGILASKPPLTPPSATRTKFMVICV